MTRQYEPFYWLNNDQKRFLEKGYLVNGQTAKERFKFIADTAEKRLGISGFSEKFYDYFQRGWFSLASPILANYGLDRGLPISCFGSYIGDSVEEIMDTASEVGVMNKVGGGTSGYFGHIRPRGSVIKDNGTSDGTFNFAKLYDTIINVISQGTTRRGQFAGYIDVEHADIDEWLDIQQDENPIQVMYYGVCIGRKWLEEMKAGDQQKRKIWGKIIKRRCETGIPYLFFRDNVNENKPDVYIDKSLQIYHQNLCAEIALNNNNLESFVCCLSSMNLLHYDEWKDTDAPKVLTYFLDSVMTEFINKAKKYKHLERAVRFAKNQRAIGIGVLGWHSYLQSKMIPFESQEAFRLNDEIFSLLQEKTLEASKELAELFGEPELIKGYGRRNATLMALAPTKSSSAILGQVSPSIEPFKANYFVKDLAKTKQIYKNPYLEELLESKGINTPEIWESILLYGGSVQHLPQLSQDEKNVFKTFVEINQLKIIQQAAQRQAYIDQSQSLNLMFTEETSRGEISKLTLLAEELGVKTLYYQFNVNAAQEFSRKLKQRDLEDCQSCSA